MGARILVIEDNPANLELLRYLLGALGHEPLSAQDGSDGLAMVRAELPDLVICDLQLPRVDGYEVARQMKSDPLLSGIPLIAVTAFAMPGDREKALAAGFDGYLSKPIAPERFLQQISEFMTRGPRAVLHDPDLHRATVLVVGEAHFSRRRLRSVLESRGLRPLFADSSHEAVGLEQINQVDFVLSNEELEPEVLSQLPFHLRERVAFPVPVDPLEFVALIETSLAGRMRAS